MAQLPVFKSSGNLANDIREIEESKAMGFGFWKSQLIEKGKARTGTTYVNGHPCMSSFNLDYVSDVEKDFLELLGMGQEQFDEINEIQANDGVRHIDFEWRPSFEGTQESLQLFYDLIKDYCPTVSTIEIYGETHYQTSGNPAVQYSKSPSTANQPEYSWKDWYQEPPTMKLYDSGMIEIHTGDIETNWYNALLNLMVMDGDRIMSYVSTATVSERVYDKGTLSSDLWYAVLGRDTYSGLFADNIHKGFGDLLTKESEKLFGADTALYYFNPTFGGDFWGFAEQDLSASITYSWQSTGFIGGLVNKYFEIKDGRYYLKYEAVRVAKPDELQYVMSNFINIKIVKDSKWYDGFVKFLGTIFNAIVRIGQGIFDFLMKIPVIGQFIELHIRFFALVLGKTYEDLKSGVRDNLGLAIVTVLTYGYSTALNLATSSMILSLEAVALIMVETLATIGFEYIAIGLYYIIEALTFAIVKGTAELTNLLDQFIQTFYQLGLEIEYANMEALEELEEVIKDQNQQTTVEGDIQVADIFNPLDMLVEQQEKLVDISLPEIEIK